MIRPSQVQLCIRSSIYWVSSTNTIPMKSSPSSRGCLQKAPPGPTRLLDLPRHLETIDPLSSIVVLNFLLNPPTFILCTFLRAWLDQILLYILLVPKRHVLKSTFIVVLFVYYMLPELFSPSLPVLLSSFLFTWFFVEKHLHSFLIFLCLYSIVLFFVISMGTTFNILNL